MKKRKIIIFVINSFIIIFFCILIAKFLGIKNAFVDDKDTTILTSALDNVSLNDKETINQESTTQETTMGVILETTTKEIINPNNNNTKSNNKVNDTTTTVSHSTPGYSYTIRYTSTAPTTQETTYIRPTTEPITIKTNGISTPVTDKTNKVDKQFTSTDKAEVNNNYQKAQEILVKVNVLRQEVGKNNLSYNENLSLCANIRAKELPNNYSHYRPNKTAFNTVLDEYNISYISASENIARGYTNFDELVTSWKNSSTHYNAIINGNYNKCGIGIYNNYYVLILTN